MQTECLVVGGSGTTIHVSVRFLQLVARRVGEFSSPLHDWPERGWRTPWRMVESLQVGDVVIMPGKRRSSRRLTSANRTWSHSPPNRDKSTFIFDAGQDREPLRDPDGAIVGLFDREHRPIDGSVDLSAEIVGEGPFRLTVRIENQTPWSIDETGATATRH